MNHIAKKLFVAGHMQMCLQDLDLNLLEPDQPLVTVTAFMMQNSILDSVVKNILNDDDFFNDMILESMKQKVYKGQLLTGEERKSLEKLNFNDIWMNKMVFPLWFNNI